MHHERPENEWIQAYKRGDLTALDRLVEHFRKPLFSFIINMLQGQGDAEEIFQEVWLRAIKHLNAYRDKNFAGWLFRIAHNVFIDEIRRNKRIATSWSTDEESIIETFPDQRPLPSDLASDADLGCRIRTALSSLPPDQREVFLMRSEADLSFKEIAKAQGISLNTALSRMNYALQKLRPLLTEEYQALATR